MLSFLELILFALLGRHDLLVLRTLPTPSPIFSFSSIGIFLPHLLWPATLSSMNPPKHWAVFLAHSWCPVTSEWNKERVPLAFLYRLLADELEVVGRAIKIGPCSSLVPSHQIGFSLLNFGVINSSPVSKPVFTILACAHLACSKTAL